MKKVARFESRSHQTYKSKMPPSQIHSCAESSIKIDLWSLQYDRIASGRHARTEQDNFGHDEVSEAAGKAEGMREE